MDNATAHTILVDETVKCAKKDIMIYHGAQLSNSKLTNAKVCNCLITFSLIFETTDFVPLYLYILLHFILSVLIPSISLCSPPMFTPPSFSLFAPFSSPPLFLFIPPLSFSLSPLSLSLSPLFLFSFTLSFHPPISLPLSLSHSSPPISLLLPLFFHPSPYRAQFSLAPISPSISPLSIFPLFCFTSLVFFKE